MSNSNRRELKAARSTASSLIQLSSSSSSVTQNRETLALIVNWDLVDKLETSDELDLYARIALACVIADEMDILKSTRAPNEPEMVAIAAAVNESTSGLAQLSDHCTEFLNHATTLVDSGVSADDAPVRLHRLSANEKVEVVLDADQINELSRDPEMKKVLTNILPQIATPRKNLPPTVSSSNSPSFKNGNFHGNSDTSHQSLSKDKQLDAKAKSLVDSITTAQKHRLSVPRSDPSMPAISAAESHPPQRPAPHLPAVTPPSPARFIGTPQFGITGGQASTPIAVATPMYALTTGAVSSVYLPRNFGGIRGRSMGNGSRPSDPIAYNRSASAIGRLLAKEGGTTFNRLDYVDYVSWILDLSENHTWDSVMNYDEEFRQLVELGEILWTHRPTDLEAVLLRQKPAPFTDYSRGNGSSLKRFSRGAQASSQSSDPAAGICINWNKGACFHQQQFGKCKYQHVCSKCKQDHRVIDHPNETGSSGQFGGTRSS
jgi:hypothetical protein